MSAHVFDIMEDNSNIFSLANMILNFVWLCVDSVVDSGLVNFEMEQW